TLAERMGMDPTTMNRSENGISGVPAHVESEILAFPPSETPHFLDEGGQIALIFHFSCRSTHEHADAPHAVALLRVRHERPRRRAAECGDEVAPSKANTHLALPRQGALSRQHSTAQACGGCQIGCCTAESRPPPPRGLWQRWVISTRNRPEHFSSAFPYE